jgi:hypothetical protein
LSFLHFKSVPRRSLGKLSVGDVFAVNASPKLTMSRCSQTWQTIAVALRHVAREDRRITFSCSPYVP